MITKAGVDSGKVVVGVSSYDRSFNMAEAGCYSKDCFFTGSATASDASKGPCSDTAGYISNAEINDIIVNNASRVNQNFIDSTSNSRIVVYDNNQWVAFMDDSIRTARTAIYKGLGMGGTTNWATDLEKYHDAPSMSKDWSAFRLSIKRGDNPYAVGDRHGNWTDLKCNDPAIQNAEHITPQERWNMLDGSDAWKDVMELVQFGGCKFGIQGLNKHGNADFHVGAQDIVDIITDSIKRFGGSGKVGAKGRMDCKGDVNSQDVEWGLY